MMTLADDDDQRVRVAVAKIVSHMAWHDQFQIPLLKRRLEVDKDKTVRLEAARSLLQLRRPAAATALAEGLKLNPPTREITQLMTTFVNEQHRALERRQQADRRHEEQEFQGEERRKQPDRRKQTKTDPLQKRVMTLEDAVAAMKEGPKAGPNGGLSRQQLIIAAVVLGIMVLAGLVLLLRSL